MLHELQRTTAASDPQLVQRLLDVEGELHKLKSRIRLGDYASTLFNDLKATDCFKGISTKPASAVSKILEQQARHGVKWQGVSETLLAHPWNEYYLTVNRCKRCDCLTLLWR